MNTKDEKFNKFSVPLGLLDYINPICYCITMVTIIRSTREDMGQPYSIIFLVGAIISIFFGFVIPTGKVMSRVNYGANLVELREKYDLHMTIERFISDEYEADHHFIRK